MLQWHPRLAALLVVALLVVAAAANAYVQWPNWKW